MNKILHKFVAFATLLVLVPSAYAVYQLVIIQKPFHARSLAGVVVGPGADGAPISGAVVDEYDAGFQHIIGTVKTDASGRFASPNAQQGTTHYLRCHAPGFNPLQFTVRIGHSARGQVRLNLPIGG